MNLKSIWAIIDSKMFDKVMYLVIFAISVAVAILPHYKNAFFSVNFRNIITAGCCIGFY
ncbi:hypothetical protein Metvu_1382 [Methanocaldococcus vulcanius M7]|uniref:Uncharacterized protein n=1 Tax=Methanocaldococcus vulcanius (strain ATCC 700851 / DSM 12094 / M7) TaxID=579137 RepID=C9RI33_METVM|nr:hypothetical protein [Methanocaldococcus vulcanius]ACX73235.1 hypothetical protein Metvu_1382 [Methanocaldococcus vulcanius M7]